MSQQERWDAFNQMTDVERYMLLIWIIGNQPKVFDQAVAHQKRPARVIPGTVEEVVPR